MSLITKFFIGVNIVRLKRILAVLLMAAMIFSMSGCNGNLALYINAKAGDVYKYHMVVNTTSDVETSGQKISTVQDMTQDFSVKIDEVDSEGNMSIAYTYDAVKLTNEAMGQKTTIDSKNTDASDPMSKMYSSIIGKSFTVKMSKLGEIKEVNGLSELMDSMISSGLAGDESTEAIMGQVKDQLKQNFGDEAMKSSLEMTTKVFPKEGVKPGDTWNTTFSLNAVVKLDMTINYTLEKVEGEIAYVDMKADFKTDGSKAANFGGMEMKADLSGTMTGKMKVNVKNGFLSEGEMTQDMSGKMEVEIAGAGKMDMPLKSVSKVTYSTVKQ